MMHIAWFESNLSKITRPVAAIKSLICLVFITFNIFLRFKYMKKRMKTGRYIKMSPFSKFRGLMYEKLPLFSVSCIPLKNTPFFAKMGTSMYVGARAVWVTACGENPSTQGNVSDMCWWNEQAIPSAGPKMSPQPHRETGPPPTWLVTPSRLQKLAALWPPPTTVALFKWSRGERVNLQAKFSATVHLFGGDSSHTPFFDWQSFQGNTLYPLANIHMEHINVLNFDDKSERNLCFSFGNLGIIFNGASAQLFPPGRNGNSAGSEVTRRPMAAEINRCRLAKGCDAMFEMVRIEELARQRR